MNSLSDQLKELFESKERVRVAVGFDADTKDFSALELLVGEKMDMVRKSANSVVQAVTALSKWTDTKYAVHRRETAEGEYLLIHIKESQANYNPCMCNVA